MARQTAEIHFSTRLVSRHLLHTPTRNDLSPYVCEPMLSLSPATKPPSTLPAANHQLTIPHEAKVRAVVLSETRNMLRRTKDREVFCTRDCMIPSNTTEPSDYQFGLAGRLTQFVFHPARVLPSWLVNNAASAWSMPNISCIWASNHSSSIASSSEASRSDKNNDHRHRFWEF